MMIYLNNAATTYPKPKTVIQAVSDYLNNFPNNNNRIGIDGNNIDNANYCRNLLKDFFHINDDPERIVFTSGSTESINLALKGLPLKGKHIITTTTEHNSVLRPLNYLKREGETEVSIVNCDSSGFVNPDDIKEKIKSNTALIVVNHCSNVTGTVQDIKSIVKIAHENNALVLIDSSQACGVFDFSVDDLDVDLMAFTGHKSLYGIQGIGGLYVKSGVELEPLKSGGTGIMGEYEYQPDRMPFKLEAGTSNLPGIVSLIAGISWINEVGLATIHKRKKEFISRITNEFKNNNRIKIYSSCNHNSYSVFCFNVEDEIPEEINFIFDQSFNIKIRSGLHCAPLIRKDIGAYPFGTLRVSPSYFSKDEEIDFFIEALHKITNTVK